MGGSRNVPAWPSGSGLPPKRARFRAILFLPSPQPPRPSLTCSMVSRERSSSSSEELPAVKRQRRSSEDEAVEAEEAAAGGSGAMNSSQAFRLETAEVAHTVVGLPRSGLNARGLNAKDFGVDDELFAAAENEKYDHLPGAVVRMRARNFMTYTDMVCLPSPKVNIIAGPNGSGKSSIVSALLIGLGGHVSKLGRSKELAAFIRHNCQEAIIDIDLRAKDNSVRAIDRGDGLGRVVAFQCTVHNDGTTTWTLNGKKVNAKAVQKEVAELKADVNSELTFLPQDMVTEFAQLDHKDLLAKMQSACENKDLKKWHEQLINWQTEFVEQSDEVRSKAATIERLRDENRPVEREKERFEQRERMQAKLEMQRAKRPRLLYERARQDYREMANTMRELARRVKVRMDELEPLRVKAAEAQKECEDNRTAAKGVRVKINKAKAAAESLAKEREAAENDLDEAVRKLDNAENKRQRLIKDQEKTQSRADDIRAKLDKLEEDAAREDVDAKRKEYEQQSRDYALQLADAKPRLQRAEADASEAMAMVRELERKLRSVSTVEARREAKFRGQREGTTHGILERLRGQLRDPAHAFGPITYEITVRDDQAASCVFNSIPASIRGAFVVSNDDDARLLQREFPRGTEIQTVGVEGRTSRGTPYHSPAEGRQLELAERTRWLTPDLRQRGIVGTVADLIAVPDLVFLALLKTTGISAAANCQPGCNVDDLMARRINGVKTFYRGMEKHQVVGSKYHNGVSSAFEPMYKTKYIFVDNDQGGGSSREALQSTLHARQQTLQDHQRARDEVKAEINRIKSAQSAVSREMSTLGNPAAKRTMLKTRLENEERNLALFKRQLSTLTLDALQKEIAAPRAKYARKVVETSECLARFLELVRKAGESAILFERASKVRQNARQALKEGELTIRSDRRDLDDMEVTVKAKREQVRRLRDEAVRLSPPGDEEYETRMAELPADLRSLDRAIEETSERLKNLTGIDPKVIEQYELRVAQIRELETQVEDMRARVDALTGKMDHLEAKWRPALEAIIGTINEKFGELFAGRSGCSGGVSLSEVAKYHYSEYELDIQVSFRENEPLRSLNQGNQSGGEKSVATMLFLLALQHVTSAAFRLVDEINQGMDAVNEAYVMKIAQHVTATSPQFFVVTPKIIANLSYFPHTTVHIVFNGNMNPYDASDAPALEMDTVATQLRGAE